MRRLALILMAAFTIGLWAAPSGAQTVVTPGAFCTPLGAIGVTSAGTSMVCSLTAADIEQPRWRDASTPGLITNVPIVPSEGPDTTTTTVVVHIDDPPVAQCDPSYPDFCIPPSPPDLNCADILPQFSIHVLPPDPHGFDADHDGIGCESNAPVTTAPATVNAGTIVNSNALPRTGNTTNRAAVAGFLALLFGSSCLYVARRRRSTNLP